MTRSQTPRCPASSTSSGSPRRTFALSSEPERAVASATSAPAASARFTSSSASPRSFVRSSLVICARTLAGRQLGRQSRREARAARRNQAPVQATAPPKTSVIQSSEYPSGPPETDRTPKSPWNWA